MIDGDTIALNGKTIHLVGFIAPETRDAQCKAERDLGDKAARRMRDLILAGGLATRRSYVRAPQPRWASGFAISAAPAARLKRTAGTLVTFWSRKGWRPRTRVAGPDVQRRRGSGANDTEPEGKARARMLATDQNREAA